MPTTASISPTVLKFGRNMRTQELDESLLRELGESMRVKQLQRIVVTPDYTVVAGNRRGRAAQLVGLESVDVEILDEMPGESLLRMYQFAENHFREDASDWEKCQTCYELVQLNVTWRSKDVAEFLRIDPSMVLRYLSFTKCIPAVRDALREGKIGISTVYTISKEAEEQQQPLLELALSGASRDAVEAFRRKGSGKGKWNGSSAKANRITVPLKSGLTLIVIGQKLSMDAVHQAFSDVTKESKRACEQNLEPRTFEGLMRDKQKGTA